jgi:hypothetical protein
MHKPKSVRWSTITVYEFDVEIGGSAIPKRGGPSIGLSRRAKYVWSTTVDQAKFALSEEEVLANKENNKESINTSTNSTKKSNSPIRKSRSRKVRWLKPLERINILTKAGFSEKKIYRMMMECSRITQSRRLCLLVDGKRVS